MPFTKYWSLSDEELLHTAFTAQEKPEDIPMLAHELAMRLAYKLDEDEADAAPEPEWVKELFVGDNP